MPFVRISLLKSLPPDTREKISHAVHQSLIDAFTVPKDDFFQVIDALEPSQLFYPKSYLDINHSGNMVYIQIVAGSGRSYEQKEKLYDLIASGIAKETEILKEDVIIVLVENGTKENWSFGNGKIQELSHIKK